MLAATIKMPHRMPAAMSEAPVKPTHATPPAPAGEQGLSISAVERDTGLTKDTLRVWERRYGFPRPLRDAQGERVYPGDQVGRLRLLRRLLVLGHRPGRVVGLPREQLEQILARHAPSGVACAPGAEAPLQRLLALLRAHDPAALQRELLQAQMRLGLQRFVVELVAPLSTEVGAAWMRGELEVFEEHQFSEILHRLLRNAISAFPGSGAAPQARPRILLTTIAEEPHGLGLLMAEAMLVLEGCHCVSLGVQTPISDMLRAADAHRADVVALSFSALPTRAQVLDALGLLRAGLPPQRELWAGGSSPALERCPLGVQAVRSLQALAPRVAAWRASHGAR